MFNKMMSDKIFCGLDIGSQRIKAAVLQKTDKNSVELVGVYEMKAQGFHEGAVVDLGEFSDGIQRCVSELSKRTSLKVKDVQLGISGELIDVRSSSAIIPLVDRGTKIIGGRDIEKINKNARLLGVKIEEEILHDLPLCYQVDEINSALNPMGLLGRKLGVESLMIVAARSKILNIVKAVNQAGYDVSSVGFDSYVACDLVLTPKEREEGCLLMDMGGRVTTLLFFKDKVLKKVSTIPWGGEHLSKALAAYLKIPFDLAEEIKKSYAAALPTENVLNEEILVKREENYFPIKGSDIHQALDPEINLFLEKLKASIADSHLFDQLGKGIVCIGGGALLPGLIEKLGQQLNLSVHLGKISLASQKGISNNALYASVIGLAYEGYKKNTKDTLSSNQNLSLGKRLSHKIKELYVEYF